MFLFPKKHCFLKAKEKRNKKSVFEFTHLSWIIANCGLQISFIFYAKPLSWSDLVKKIVTVFVR